MKKIKAFSIIELTIVIILIGLLSIVILTGTQLIAEAKTRAVINKITDFEKAIFMFQKLHEFLPGDFPHTNIWLDEDIANTCYKIKDADGTIATGADRPDQIFIKGNGDGLVSATNPNETDFVTCHLVLGGMLSKTPNVGLGITSIAGTWYKTPKESKYKAGYFIDNVNRLSLIILPSYTKGNTISLSSSIPTPDRSPPRSPIVSDNNGQFNNTVPFYMLRAIDIKMDDGKPGTGQIIFLNNASYSALAPICNKTNGYLCAPDSTFSTDIAKNAKGRAILVYRPHWLNSE